eukprot:TRINITY_DN905_c0_g1::TRINITY_DN905_c0_g1_i1::g.16010::m.16010 TRINITY_DN905_c0_g1::TRINITY_DN905_c0_g1_i1::g.16010  ORF type:complete len:228 (+),score=39.43,sp/Q9JJW6/ALRF2_MOUSE/32.69/2e-12,RRM_1/PF00076.17/6.5e-06,RRM_6/PF14259.1/0.00044 TRINITY_DN905_c0_g1_i1:27-686(+)
MTDLDKTLDELVKERRTAQRQPRGGATRGAGASRGGATRSFRGRATTTRGGRGGRATTTTFGARNNNAGTPLGVRRTIQRNRPVATTPRHTAQPQAAPSGPRILSITTGGAKLIVRNLDAGVSTQDINDLFGDVGALKKAEVRFDRSGRSTGVAEVKIQAKGRCFARFHRIALRRRYEMALLNADLARPCFMALSPKMPMKIIVDARINSSKFALFLGD